MRSPLSKHRASSRPIFVLAALAVALLSACAAPRPSESARPTGPLVKQVDPRGVVSVAMLVPLSAADATAARYADALANSARLALSDQPESDIRLSVYDTAGLPETATASARRAIAEGADMIIGPLFGANTAEIAPLAEASGIQVLSFSNRTPIAGGPVWLLGNTFEADIRRIASYAARVGGGQIALFFGQTEEGEAARRGADQVEARGIAQVAVRLPYERSVEGIRQAAGPFADAVRASGATAVLLPSGGQELTAVAGAIRANGIGTAQAQLLGTQRWRTRTTLEDRSLRGGWFAGPDPVRLNAFNERYTRAYGEPPAALAYLGYDAMAIATRLVTDGRAFGLGNAFAVEQLLRPDGFIGALGPLRFTPDQTVERATAVLEVGRRGFDVREAAPASFAAGL